MPDLKRAPAPAWPHLTRLLRSLEVGESGVLRVEVEPEHGGELIMRSGKCIEAWGGGERHVASRMDAKIPPLRPGWYWVPEEWWCSRVGLDRENLWKFEYRQRGVRPWPARVVRMDEGWTPGKDYGWRSPWHLPARAARLACEVGEARVEDRCFRCGGEGRVTGVTPALDYINDGATIQCPSCLGSPGPWWVYEVKRIEVE